MRDIDDLLTGEVGRAASDSADAPRFASLAARGRRRQNRVRAVMAGAGALAVAAVLVSTQLIDGGPTSSPDPAAPDPAPKVQRADAIINSEAADKLLANPHSKPVDVETGQEDDSRAVTWACTRACGGGGGRMVVALTDDDFATRTTFLLPGHASVVPVGDGRIVVERWTNSAPLLLSADGTRTEIEVEDRTGPVAPGEVVVGSQTDKNEITSTPVAVDPETATGHRLSVSEDAASWRHDGEIITVLAASGRIQWSTDDGVWWSSGRIDSGDDVEPVLVPSADSSHRAVVLTHQMTSRQNAFGSVYSSADDFARRERTEDPKPQVWGELVLPDGRMLIAVNGWTDEWPVGAVTTAPGLYVSRDDDWTRFDPLPQTGPFAEEETFRPELLEVDVSDGSAAIYVQRSQEVVVDGEQAPDATIYRSDDAGATWTEVKGK